jgi:hypothetical protein
VGPRGAPVADSGGGRGLAERDSSTWWIAGGWFALAMLARAPFVARIEGALDHDQSVVGLMALDIAAGRRFPIFFDGQRYMGAVEAYVASAFVRVLGHSPGVVALASLLAFGLFAAGQFVVWSRWRDRTTGHVAAALTVLGSPMLVLWGIIPRGGYVEFLAWALPTLAVYRRIARPGRTEPTPIRQAAWGFLLAVGYYLNPLSLTVYATIALDWTLGRHGDDLKRDRLPRSSWLDRTAAPAVWLLIAVGWVLALAICGHVDPKGGENGSPYIVFGGLSQARSAVAVGAVGVGALLGLAGWWSRGPIRLYESVARWPYTLLGVMAAWSPFVAYGVMVRLGALSAAPSLPVWIAAPWRAGGNVRSAMRALGPLVGCDPRAIETVLIGQGVDPPLPRWPILELGLLGLSPLVIAVVVTLIVVAAWRERSFWSRAFGLRGEDVAPPIALMVGFLAVTAGLYLLQGTSPNASSIRYLVPVWVALPGLLACGLGALPRRARVLAGLLVFVPWGAAQFGVWSDLDRSSPARPLAVELTHRGISGVVAPTPVALIVANLTHGAVGAVEYQAIWPRLGDRYRDRFPADRPLTCIVDRRFPWAIRGEGGWAPEQDFGRHLRGLSTRHPGRVKPAWTVGSFEVWEVDLPLDLVLALEPDSDESSPAGDQAVARRAGR